MPRSKAYELVLVIPSGVAELPAFCSSWPPPWCRGAAIRTSPPPAGATLADLEERAALPIFLSWRPSSGTCPGIGELSPPPVVPGSAPAPAPAGSAGAPAASAGRRSSTSSSLSSSPAAASEGRCTRKPSSGETQDISYCTQQQPALRARQWWASRCRSLKRGCGRPARREAARRARGAVSRK